MNTKLKLIALLICSIFFLASCNVLDLANRDGGMSGTGSGEAQSVDMVAHVEKGPFIIGSELQATVLDKNGITLQSKTYTISGDDGSVTLEDIAITKETSMIRFSATGRYFNEVTGDISTDTITLNSLWNLESATQSIASEDSSRIHVYINTLTHLAYNVATVLSKEQGMSLQDSFEQAQQSVVQTLSSVTGVNNISTSFTTMSMLNHPEVNQQRSDYLLYVSALLLQSLEDENSAISLTQLLEQLIEQSIAGDLNAETYQTLIQAHSSLDIDQVLKNLHDKYGEAMAPLATNTSTITDTFGSQIFIENIQTENTIDQNITLKLLYNSFVVSPNSASLFIDDVEVSQQTTTPYSIEWDAYRWADATQTVTVSVHAEITTTSSDVLETDALLINLAPRESWQGTSPSDMDQDYVLDDQDNCPTIANPLQTNTDNDTAGNACDTDDDNDTFSDIDELAAGTDPLDASSTPRPFVFSINGGSFTIVTLAVGTFLPDYDVDCNNDGINEAVNLSGNYTCNYSSSDTYTISISGKLPHFKAATPLTSFVNDNALKIISIDQWGDNPWRSMNHFMAHARNMTLSASDSPNLTHTSDASFMFFFAVSMNSDLSNWDVSNITNMERMFDSTFLFDQNIGAWDISNVTNMNNMFLRGVLSTANYDALLNGWSQLNLQQGVSFGAWTTQYSNAGLAARNTLTNTFNWTITDGGLAP